jgi:ATP-dependent Zn protease
MVDRRGGGEARAMTGSVKQLVLIWAMVLGLLAVMNVMSAEEPKPEPTFAEFLDALDRGEVHKVDMRTRDNSVRVERAGGGTYTVGYPDEYAPALVEQLRASETPFDIEPGGSGLGGMLLRVLLPLAVLLGFGLLVLRRSRGGGGRYGAFRRAPTRQPAPDGPKTSFADVAGVDEAVEELREITDFLRARRGSKPLVRESRRACSCTARVAPARSCWRARSRVRRACRSSRSRARTSSRCSSV